MGNMSVLSLSNYTADGAGLLHDVLVEVSYGVRSAVDERRCLVLFVWSNARTAESVGRGVSCSRISDGRMSAGM